MILYVIIQVIFFEAIFIDNFIDNVVDNFFDNFGDTFDATSNNTFNTIVVAVFDTISGDTSDDIDITESIAPGKDLLGLIYFIYINVIQNTIL